MDLSWPKSVSDGVKKDQYLRSYFTLHYLSLDNITVLQADLCNSVDIGNMLDRRQLINKGHTFQIF